MYTVKEDNYYRISRNFILKTPVKSLDEFITMGSLRLLGTKGGAMFPALQFRRRPFENIMWMIQEGRLFYCERLPLSEVDLKYQYQWELEYARFAKSRLLIYTWRNKNPNTLYKKKKIYEMRIIKYETLLKRLEEETL